MDKATKQRLLGGVVLVAGAALFLPVLLDGSGAALTIPPLPAAPETAGVEAMAPALDEQVAATEKAVEAAHAERDAAEAAEAATPPVGEGEVAPDAAAAPQADAGPVPPQAGVPAKSSPAPTVAPATTAASATAAKPASKVAPAANLVPAKPVVAAPAAPAKAAAPAPTSKPAASASLPEAWVVQVAVLSSRDKAEALVRKLRAKNYPAVLKPLGGNWKVLVGPELSRDVAESAKARMAADPELKLSGWVQSYKP